MADGGLERTRDGPQVGALIQRTQSLTIHKRDYHHRVFVNRSLNLDKIRFYGFDMDYTLAVYKSPVYEELSFKLFLERMVQMGYPDPILDFEYDARFPIRGLWFDTTYGNLLKVDAFGNILSCVHGFRFLSPHEIRELYPNKFLQLDDTRVYVSNTLYNLPETYLLACLIDFFTNSPLYTREPTGVKCGDVYMSYKSIYQDVRRAVEHVHIRGELKSRTCDNLEQFIEHNENLSLLLSRIRSHGAKSFLLTNSEYWYTEKVMRYLVGPEWTTMFDYIVIDAMKPLFFGEGTILRQIDKKTGKQQIGNYTGALLSNNVYSGGSCEVFSKLIGAQGKDVLYIGDHIFGDILKSKKIQGWRTLLIVPELGKEMEIWSMQQELFLEIQTFEAELSEMYRNLDIGASNKPDSLNLQAKLRAAGHKMDMAYGLFGSLFRSGSRQTFFAAQVTRYADLYAANVTNLIWYPLFYMFKAPTLLMAHETFTYTDPGTDGGSLLHIAEGRKPGELGKFPDTRYPRQSMVPHLRAEQPKNITHTHDDDESDEADEIIINLQDVEPTTTK